MTSMLNPDMFSIRLVKSLFGKQGSRVILLLSIVSLTYLSAAMAAQYQECIYTKIDQERVIHKNCIKLELAIQEAKGSGDAMISKEVLAKAFYDSDGLSCLESGGSFFYFNKNGFSRSVIAYDNGPDYFVEGLARTSQNGKIGFFDKKLQIVIKPQYDFAFPFKNGVSIVCNGCIKKPLGEHFVVEEGKWGTINRKGKIVRQIIHSKEEIQK